MADPGPTPKFSDTNDRFLSITCSLVRRLKTYISSRFNVYHHFIECQICKDSERIQSGSGLLLLLDQSTSREISSAGHCGIKMKIQWASYLDGDSGKTNHIYVE